MSRATFHEKAEAEVRTAARWYEQRQPGLGMDFREEVEAAVSTILRSPEAFGFVTEGIRQHLVHRFPFSIVYRPEGDLVYVIAVAHSSRDPDYWKDRL